MVTWPVFEPGTGSLADLYPYDVEIDQPVDIEIDQPVDIDVEFQADEETTEPMPSAWLVERCTTAAGLRSTK